MRFYRYNFLQWALKYTSVGIYAFFLLTSLRGKTEANWTIPAFIGLIASSLPNPKVYTVAPLSKYVAEKYPRVLRGMNNLERDPDIQKLLTAN